MRDAVPGFTTFAAGSVEVAGGAGTPAYDPASRTVAFTLGELAPGGQAACASA